MTALVLAWGNPSRGDDALGPCFAEQIERCGYHGVECLVDFQLQVEHVLDLEGRQRVLFVDASHAAGWSDAECFRVTRLHPGPRPACGSHAMRPDEVLRVWSLLKGSPPPPSWLLAIRGYRFALGEEVSDAAQRCLREALVWAKSFLRSSADDCANA